MSSEMQERIARAIWNIRREYDDRCDMELEDMGRGHEVWELALAAMKAMREPTEPMMTAAAKAGDVAIQNGELWPGRDSAGLVLSAAFDAEISLAEGGQG